MTPWFADTHYYLALINPDDDHHERRLSWQKVHIAW